MAIGGGQGGGRGASDVRAGGAFFEIYAKDGLSGVIDKLEAKVKRFAGSLRRIGAQMAGSGAVLGAGPLGFLLGGINRAGDISNLSRQFQIPIDQMARLKYAADEAGASVEDVIANPGLYSELLREAPGMNPEDAARAVSIQREWRLSTVALQNAMLSVLDVIAPVVKLVAQFVQQNASAIVVVGAVAAGLFVMGTAITTIGTVLGGAVALFGAFSTLIAFVATPLGAVVVGLGALSVATLAWAVDWKSMGQTFQEVWGGIIDAVKGGNLELAFEIVAAGVKVIWFKLVTQIAEKFRDTINGILQSVGKYAAIFAPGLASSLGLGLNFGGGFLTDAYAGLASSQAELTRLRQQAAAGVHSPELQQLSRAAEFVRGGFGSDRFGSAFAYGEKAGLHMLEDIRNGKGGLPDAIGAAVAASLVVR